MAEQDKLMITSIYYNKEDWYELVQISGSRGTVRKVMFGERIILGGLPIGGEKPFSMFSCLNAAERRLTIAGFPLVTVLTDIHEHLQKMSERNLVSRHR